MQLTDIQVNIYPKINLAYLCSNIVSTFCTHLGFCNDLFVLLCRPIKK